MIIGSLDITHDKNNFSITHNNHPYHNLLIDSFDLPYKPNFYADNVCSLDEFIKTNNFSIYTANKMLISIYNQLLRLSHYFLSVSFFDITDIIVIDSHHFYFCNIDKLFPVVNNNLNITHFYDVNNHFLPPEFKSNTKIPFNCHENTGYYSLALIILFSLKQTNSILSALSNDDILDYYKSTKMYSILKLCLADKSDKRHFIIF